MFRELSLPVVIVPPFCVNVAAELRPMATNPQFVSVKTMLPPLSVYEAEPEA